MKDSLKAFDELKYDKSDQSLEPINNLVTVCKNVGLEVFKRCQYNDAKVHQGCHGYFASAFLINLKTTSTFLSNKSIIICYSI